MSESFRLWLQQELNRLEWTHAKLATKAGVSRSLVTRVLLGNADPSADFCVKIAKTLDQPTERVLRLAEILPPGLPEDNPDLQELLTIFQTLPPAQQKQVLEYVQFVSRK